MAERCNNLRQDVKNFGRNEIVERRDERCSGSTFTIDDAVNKSEYGKFQIRLLLLAGLGWVADACEIFILSVIGGFIACDWEFYRWQNALLTSVVFVGNTISGPVLGTLADVYGRKKSLAGSVVILFLFGAASAASPSYAWMVVFRGCVGFAVGGLSQGLTLCTEYCPPDMRGKAGLYLCYFWSLGTVGVIFLTWIVMEYLDNWRILLFVVSLPSLIVIISLKWYPESARYLLVSQQYDRAVKLLQKMLTTNGKELIQGQLVVASVEKRGRVKDLLNNEYRVSSLLFLCIWFGTAFTYYSIALVSPLIIQNGSIRYDERSNGTFPLEEFTDRIECSRLTKSNYIDLLWTSAAEFPGLLVFTILIERMGRKILIGGSCIVSGVLILLLLIRTQKIIILLLLFATRGIILAVFQLCIVVTAETYPTTFRAVAIGFGSVFSRVGGLIAPYVAQVLVIESPTAAMCLLAGIIFLSGVAAFFLPYETRGAGMKDSKQIIEQKTEKEIQRSQL